MRALLKIAGTYRPVAVLLTTVAAAQPGEFTTTAPGEVVHRDHALQDEWQRPRKRDTRIPRQPLLWLAAALLFTLPPMFSGLVIWVPTLLLLSLAAKFWMEPRGYRLRFAASRGLQTLPEPYRLRRLWWLQGRQAARLPLLQRGIDGA